MARKWKVLENTLCDGWSDDWTEEVNGVDKPLRFKTKAAAEAEIKDLLTECRRQRMSGYSRADYKIVRA